MRIAPRLLSGQKRIPGYSGLPPELRRIIDRIARREKCSRSWVIEQIILDWANINVDYRTPMSPVDHESRMKDELILKQEKARLSKM